MIGKLTGISHAHIPSTLILDVRGVVYLVRVTSGTYQQLTTNNQQPVSLFTHLAVRENALDLYGFLEEKELRFFELLLSVSGVGPKTALTVVSIADIDAIESAVAQGNSSYLTKVAGIGRKIAEKIIVELRDKVGKSSQEGMGGTTDDEDVLEALRSLGYQANEAREALRKIEKNVQGASDRLKA